MSDSGNLRAESSLPSGGRFAWLVCLSAGLFFFYEFFQLTIFDVINQFLRQDFHLNAVQLSWMSSSFLWANILFLLPAGMLLDRYSTRIIIIAALLTCIIGTFGFALTDSFRLACFFHFLSGIGNAFCFLSCVVLVSRWFPPARQALVIGTVVTMAFLGGMVAHTPFSLLSTHLGWRQALLIDGVLGLLILVVIVSFVKDSPFGLRIHQSTKRSTLLGSFLQACFNKQTVLGGVYTALLNLPIMVLCALWGASYLENVHHLSAMTASTVISFILVGSIVGCPLTGWLSDKQGMRRPLMIMGALLTIVLTLLLLMSTLSVGVLSFLFFGLGLVTSTQVISYPFIAESHSEQVTGLAIGIASIIIMGGAGVGQVLFGWMMAYHAGMPVVHYAAGDFQFAMLIFPMAGLVALLAVWGMRETYCKRLTTEETLCN